MKIELEPIGYVCNDRKEIMDDFWGNVYSVLKIDIEKYGKDCLKEISTFSHIEVIYYMHKLNPADVYTGARHPRNNRDFPLVGIFAQRVKSRPNLLGLSRCKIVEVANDQLVVKGLDALDGSPILDIKPYMLEFAPIGEVYEPSWVKEVMKDYYKEK